MNANQQIFAWFVGILATVVVWMVIWALTKRKEHMGGGNTGMLMIALFAGIGIWAAFWAAGPATERPVLEFIDRIVNFTF